ncbi:MAG: DUF3187 family protein [Armatimonadetes bacterium]|nr:DUF3187 family protein [Armatimonadota bacterium]
MNRSQLLIATTLSAGIVASAAQAQDAIPTRNHRSVALAFLRPVALGETLPNGEKNISWQLVIANELRRPQFNLHEDSETWRLQYTYRYTDDKGVEYTFLVPVLSRGGGVLDGFLAWYHKTLLSDVNHARLLAPNGRSIVTVPGSKDFVSASGIGDVTGAVGITKPEGTYRLWLKLPTGDASRLLGSGNVDFAVSWEKQFNLLRKLDLHAQAGLTVQGRPSELPHGRGLVDNYTLGLVYSANASEKYHFQWNSETSPTITGNRSTDAAHRVITLGFTKVYSDSQFTVYFSEDGDFGLYDFQGGAQIGPDVTFGFIWSQKK